MNNNNINIEELALVFMKLRNKDEIESFLKDILTKSEQVTISTRWEVAKKLNEGLPYTQIERETGASSATIAKVSEYLKYGYDGYRTALSRVK
jgi:TrpR-related protein YerC/YecD